MSENEEYLETFVKDIPFDTPRQEHRDQLKSQLLNAFPRYRLGPTVRTVTTGRTILKSPVMRSAAAAVIFITAIVSIALLDKSVKPAYGISDIPELFRKAKIIHVQGWTHFNLTDRGKKVSKVRVERWIDLENGRARSTGHVVKASHDRATVTLRDTVVNGQFKMVVDHGKKKTVFYRLSAYQEMLQTHYRLQDMFGYLYGNIETFEKFVKTGREDIDGVPYDIWTCEIEEPDSRIGRINRYKYWLSPTTGDSGRFESWYKNGDEPWRLGSEFYEIERDAQVGDDVFALEVPAGYEANNSKETATPVELNEQGYLGLGSVRLDARITFTLSNGSVILGWRSEDTESVVSPGEMFEDLTFGGRLPKLPIEVYALKPIGWTGDTTYTGRHLAYTQKGDKLIEWSLYVPNGPQPKRSEMLGYELLPRFNTEKRELVRSWSGFNVDYGIHIQTEEEFDTWVNGAMAELSDERGNPESVAYKDVLQLAEETRSSPAE